MFEFAKKSHQRHGIGGLYVADGQVFHIAKAMGHSIAQTYICVCAMIYRHDVCVGTIDARPCQSGLAKSCVASARLPLILHAEADGAKGSRCKTYISFAKRRDRAFELVENLGEGIEGALFRASHLIGHTW